MSDPITITVYVDPNHVNPNRANRYRVHWGLRTRIKNQAITAGRLAWKAAGCPRATGKVRVSVLVRRQRVMDEANIWGALKPVLDSLFSGNRFEGEGAVTPDDGPEWVTLGTVQQQTGKAYRGRESVTFTIESLEVNDEH